MSEPITSSFVHLHVHSEYSLLDGAIRIPELIKEVKSRGQTAVALTDHANMFGAVEFYSACSAAGIKPILGCELYHQGQEPSRKALESLLSQPGGDAFHLVLLAKSTAGYHTLLKAVSYGYLHTTHSNMPVLQEADLDTCCTDLIALSSCLRGEFGRLVAGLVQVSSDITQALQAPQNQQEPFVKALHAHVKAMHQRYGAGNYYIELIDNNLAPQKQLIPHLVKAAQFFQLPLVATADAHYLHPDFKEAHAVLTAIKNDLTFSKIRHRNQSARFHLQTDAELEELFSAYPEALVNPARIAEQCDVQLEFGKFFLPEYELGGEDINDALRRIAKEGLEERFQVLRPLYGESFDAAAEQEYWQRLDYELGVIINMGFPGYFLIVQDFINWAKREDIPVGPGRGSGAGSLVAYALKITDLDPLPLNLIFERFLNPERISMPDFDVDFCQSRRDEVIQYVTRRYGKENVAQITTFGKMKAKAAIRDVGRVLELGYNRVDKIAKLVPNELDITLEAAINQEPRLTEAAEQDSRVAELIKIARQIEGISRHTSVHAAGVVISNGPMENFVPVYKSEDGSLITQYEMKNAEKVGLVKFDFLGLKTLSVVQKASEIIRRTDDPNFNIELIDLEDTKVYKNISSGHTCGMFQLESSGMQTLNAKLKPSCFEDVIAVVALFRPGPLGSGMVDDFIERKHGRQEIKYLVPELEPILKDTYGIILYQEQVQKIAANLANYSLGEADLLRRAMGKKKPEEMAKQKTRFIEGCTENKIDSKIAEELFELMAMFAAYGFNKSHSAAYGLVTYQTAFLKTHYPAAFMAAIMTYDLDNTDKMVRYIEECKRLGFKIIRPNLNQCQIDFSVPDSKTLSFALSAIKGIGVNSLEPLIQERQARGPFQSLTELAKRVNLQRVGKKTLECLNEAGALDDFGWQRHSLQSIIPEMTRFSDHHHQAKSRGQGLLFAEDSEELTSKPAHWEQKLIKQHSHIAPLEWLLKEKKLLGAFLSAHPLELFQPDIKRFSKFSLINLAKLVGEKSLAIVCFLNAVQERFTKSGKKMAYIQIEDLSGSYEGIMFENEIPEAFPPTNSLVVCYCNIMKSFDGQNISLRIERILPLAQIRMEQTSRVHLTIQAQLDNENSSDLALLKQLKKLIKSHEGLTPMSLTLDYPESQVQISTPTKLHFDDSCFIKLSTLDPDKVQVHLQ